LTLEASLPQNSVIDALWRLEEQLRYLLRLHKSAQNAFAKKSQPTEAQPLPDHPAILRFRAR
jgi:hypothetical protein